MEINEIDNFKKQKDIKIHKPLHPKEQMILKPLSFPEIHKKEKSLDNKFLEELRESQSELIEWSNEELKENWDAFEYTLANDLPEDRLSATTAFIGFIYGNTVGNNTKTINQCDDLFIEFKKQRKGTAEAIASLANKIGGFGG